MEKFDNNYNERNTFEDYLKLEEIIDRNYLTGKSDKLKLDKIKKLLEIFSDLESFIYLCNEGELLIKESLGVDFEDLVNDLPDEYRLKLTSKLEEMARSFENSNNIKAKESKSEQLIFNEIERVLEKHSIEFSAKLNQSQIEYLTQNPTERKNLMLILETIGKIKELPSVAGKILSIQHLAASINHTKVGFTGRMTATRNEKTKKYINLSNCVETNLSGSDRFIFSLESAVDNYGNNQTIINIKVLGKPPYKHD